MSMDQIIREQREAEQAMKLAMAEARVNPELLALPDDVRNAKVALACRDEIERCKQAVIALDQENARLNERWIEAHETLGFVRASSPGASS